jgi:hypothetical protein
MNETTCMLCGAELHDMYGCVNTKCVLGFTEQSARELLGNKTYGS